MGCLSSVPECTQEEKEELCASMGREMLVLCATTTLEKPEAITVMPPPKIGQLKERAADLREKANKAREHKEEQQPAGEAGAGSGAGGLLQAGLSMAHALKDKVEEGLGKGAGAALDKLADQLDKTVEAIQAPLTSIGKSLLEQKKMSIQEAFKDQISKLNFTSALGLVRGAAPYGPAEYSAAKGDGLSLFLLQQSRAGLESSMESLASEIIKSGHAGMRAVDSAVETYNSAVGKIGEIGLPSQIPLPQPIELDASKCVAAEIVAGLLEGMGKEEMQFRKAPVGKSSFPMTFAKVFSGAKLDHQVYANKDK